MLCWGRARVWVAGTPVAPVFVRDATLGQRAFENPSGFGSADDSLSALGRAGEFAGCVVSTAGASAGLGGWGALDSGCPRSLVSAGAAAVSPKLVVSVALVLENSDSHLAWGASCLKNTARAASPAFSWPQSVRHSRRFPSQKSSARCLGRGAADRRLLSDCRGEPCCSRSVPALAPAEGCAAGRQPVSCTYSQFENTHLL